LTVTATRTCRRSAAAAPDPTDVRRPGRTGQHINHATSYWVGNHSKRVFGDSVDVVSGIGWDKVDPDNPAYRFVNVYRWCPTSGVRLQRARPSDAAVSLHPGIDAEQVQENTSFEVTAWTRPSDAASARDELKLIREVIDPKSLRDKEIRVSRLAHAADRADRHRASGRADRDGLGGGCAAGVGDSNAAASASWRRRR
jgi:hypothetical protein